MKATRNVIKQHEESERGFLKFLSAIGLIEMLPLAVFFDLTGISKNF